MSQQRSPLITTTSESPAPPLPGSAPSTPKIVYKTELYVPIKRDVESFEERQKRLFESVDTRATRRIRHWDQEMERMRSDFFRLQPFDEAGYRMHSVEDLLDGRRRLSDVFYDSSSGSQGGKRFCVSFDVGEFQPEEIKVTTDNRRIKVHAKHDQKIGDNRTISREFSRDVDIPDHVDDKSLQCTLSNDGILQIEAAVPVPAYNKIRNSVTSDILEDSAYQITPVESAALASSRGGVTVNPGTPASMFSRSHVANNTSSTTTSSRTVKTVTGGPGGPGGPNGTTTSTRTVTSTSSSGVPVGVSGGVSNSTSNECTTLGVGSSSAAPVSAGAVVSSLGGEFKVVVDDIAGDYSADEIGVRVRRGKLLVTARHESQQPGRRCFREFCREFDLPANVKIAALTATLDAGQLVLRAPYATQITAESSTSASASSEELHVPVVTRG